MWLIHSSLRRPITVFVASLALALLASLAFLRMPVDIFPNMNLPVIVVAQPYGGMDPAQMEGLRIRDGLTEWVDVKRGSTMNQLVEVFGELRTGDQVAIRGTDELRAGTRVTTRTAASSR